MDEDVGMEEEVKRKEEEQEEVLERGFDLPVGGCVGEGSGSSFLWLAQLPANSCPH